MFARAVWPLIACYASCGAADAESLTLPPFVAVYDVKYRGLSAGQLRMSLHRDTQPGRYTFETRANPSLLARLVIGRDALEQTTMEVSDTGVRPLHWQLEDGKSGEDGDGELNFDWTAGRVTGKYQGKKVDLPTQPGLQDRSSMQIAVTASLANGRRPGSILMIDGDHANEYSYVENSTAQMSTPLGQLDTIIYESTRPTSSRVSRIWHAPSLGFVAVRIEQVRKGKTETVMTLVSFERK